MQYDFNFISSDGQSVAGSFIYEDYTFVQLVDVTTGETTMLFNARAEPTGLIVPGQGLPSIAPGVTLTPASTAMTLGSGTQGNQSGGPVWAAAGPLGHRLLWLVLGPGLWFQRVGPIRLRNAVERDLRTCLWRHQLGRHHLRQRIGVFWTEYRRRSDRGRGTQARDMGDGDCWLRRFRRLGLKSAAGA